MDWCQRQKGVKFWSHVSHESISDEVIVMSSCMTAGEGQEEIFSIWDSHLFLFVCIIIQQDKGNTFTGSSFITLHCLVLHHYRDSCSSGKGLSRVVKEIKVQTQYSRLMAQCENSSAFKCFVHITKKFHFGGTQLFILVRGHLSGFLAAQSCNHARTPRQHDTREVMLFAEKSSRGEGGDWRWRCWTLIDGS